PAFPALPALPKLRLVEPWRQFSYSPRPPATDDSSVACVSRRRACAPPAPEAVSMFKLLGRLPTSHPRAVCGAWLLLGLLLALLAPSGARRPADDDIRFLPDRCPSVRGSRLLEQASPQDVFASRLVFAVERDSAPLTPADFHLVGQLVDDLERLRHAEPA